MCTVMAAVGTAVSVGTTAFGYSQQQGNAARQNAYNLQTQAIEEKYRTEMMWYNNQIYSQNVNFGYERLGYMKSEMDRQVAHVERMQDSINDNYIAKIGTVMQRQVEENIAAAFGIQTAEAQARAERASKQAQADVRGVEGNSIEAVFQDVMRQEGEAITIMEMNRNATQRQLFLSAQGLKAEADQSLYNIPFNVFAPDAPIAAPAPVGPARQAAPVQKPSTGALWGNIGTAVVNGMNTGMAQVNNGNNWWSSSFKL